MLSSSLSRLACLASVVIGAHVARASFPIVEDDLAPTPAPFSSLPTMDATEDVAPNVISSSTLRYLSSVDDPAAKVDLDTKLNGPQLVDRVDALPFGTSLSLYATSDGSPNGTLAMPIFARTSTDVVSLVDGRLAPGQRFSVTGTVDRLYQLKDYDSIYAGPMFTWRTKRNLDVLLGAEAELTPRAGDDRHFQLAFAIGYRF